MDMQVAALGAVLGVVVHVVLLVLVVRWLLKR